MKYIYPIFIFFLKNTFKVLSHFDSKIKKGWEGRKKSLEIVKANISKEDNVLWMHAASLGEYEQGLPVLEKLQEKNPHHKILVTFFSPSGYENVFKKNKEYILCYLPFDQKSVISEFVKTINPEIFFTVKYDFWYQLFAELNKIGCSVFVVSSLFYKKQIYFSRFGRWMVEELKKNIDWFFHQNQESFSLAGEVGLEKGSVTGDTRFDRVKQIRKQNNRIDYILEFKGDKKLLVFGSSWEAEEHIAQSLLGKIEDYKIIMAPHDMKRIQHLQHIFPNSVLYSQLQNLKTENPNLILHHSVLIIDSIGMLSKLYSYADIAIIGGGFHQKGLHNILEAATFGIPVFFGKHYRKNPEADELIHINGGKSFDNEQDAVQFLISLCKKTEIIKSMGRNAKKFIENQPDSSELIERKISEIRNSTN